jgi:hypothetical protein
MKMWQKFALSRHFANGTYPPSCRRKKLSPLDYSDSVSCDQSYFILCPSSFILLFDLFICLAPASAQQRLPQPQIFEELPPSSPSSLPSLNLSPSPPTLPSLPPADRELNFQAPSRPLPLRTPTLDTNFYRVDIFGDSPFLLSQVKRIEPEAFVRSGEGVIQAGVFADQFNARSRVRTLEAQGIRAKVIAIAAETDVDPVNPRRILSGSYFVIIPGELKDLPDMAASVVRLGARQSAVSQRESPRGPHIAIGPFDSRKEADRWNSYFRSVGMDARVYFGS